MKRSDFQALAKVRLRDTEALLKARRYSAAYYMSGYVIECALKACIAKLTKRFDFPPDWKTVRDNIYTHDLVNLLKVAGLSADLNAGTKANKALETNWALVKNWKETSRYSKVSRQQADDLYRAVSDPEDGILAWIERHW